MKLLLTFSILLFNNILADALPNTGLEQNKYGYYGEGVTFGGLPIVGEWRLSSTSNTVTVFDYNGTAGIRKWGDVIYSVSEDGTKLTIKYINIDLYSILSYGSNGCFYSENKNFNTNIGQTYVYYNIICKTQVNNKTYGTNSNYVTITVGTGE